MSDEDFEEIIEKLEAEREELIKCNEQFSVDNQNLKYQRDKAWQNILHWRNKSFELEEKLAVMTTERDEAWKRAAHAEKMWGEADVQRANAVTTERARIVKLLDGIDRTELDGNGWWETSFGAKFGEGILNTILEGDNHE